MTYGDAGRVRKTFVGLLPFHCESPHNILKFASINDCASIGQHLRRLFDASASWAGLGMSVADDDSQ